MLLISHIWYNKSLEKDKPLKTLISNILSSLGIIPLLNEMTFWRQQRLRLGQMWQLIILTVAVVLPFLWIMGQSGWNSQWKSFYVFPDELSPSDCNCLKVLRGDVKEIEKVKLLLVTKNFVKSRSQMTTSTCNSRLQVCCKIYFAL